MVTREDIAADLVEALVADTLASLPELAVRAPVLQDLSPELMKSRGLTAPMHPGAVSAFAAPRSRRVSAGLATLAKSLINLATPALDASCPYGPNCRA